jgi:hypothetical protein
MGDLGLQRRRWWGCGFEHRGDPAEFGVHAGRRDHRQAAALGHGGSLEDHVETVAQRSRVGQRGRVLEHRLALAGERGFLHVQRDRLHQTCIRAHGIAFAEHQHIATDQLGTRYAQRLPAAHHGRGHGGHAGQRSDGIRRLGFMQVSQQPVEHDDRCDDDRVDRPAFEAVERPSRQGNGDGRQQQVDKRVAKLRQHAAPGRRGRGAAQFVRAVLQQPA